MQRACARQVRAAVHQLWCPAPFSIDIRVLRSIVSRARGEQQRQVGAGKAGGWDHLLETTGGAANGRLRRLPASVRLVLPIAAAAILLATPTTATAAPSVSSASGPNVLQAVGEVQASVLTASPHKGQGKAASPLPAKFMHPDELRTAKVKAAAAPPTAPSQPATSTAPAAAALFNGLNQPGLAAADEGSGATPPDSTGAIGPTRYVELVNQMIGVYDRSNLSLLSRTDLASFVGVPAGVASTDPQIQWDPQANRWLYAEIGYATGNNYLVFGWTKTADPSDLAAGWCHHGIATGHSFEDYPKLGHDAHFLIVGTNVYDDGAGFPFITANLFAIPKPAANDSTCSSPVTATYFADATHLLKNTDGTLAFTPVPANASDSVTNDYIFGAHDPTLAPQSKVMVWHMTFQPNPVLVADGDISVGTFAIPASVPQPGTSYQVDSLDGRLTQAVAHFDPRVGAEAFWTQHTIAGSGGRSLVRWYEFAPSMTSPIVQTGQVSSSDFIWNAAISPSIVGSDAAIFYNRGSKTQLAMIGAQSRTGSTPAGTMDPGEVPLGTSSAADQENAFQGNCTTNPCRWGDYSGASPDPANAGVVWGSNQLMGPVFLGYAQWTTRNFAITTGASAGPDFSLAASPASQTVTAGSSTTYTININRTGGFTGTVALSSSGAPAGASATFNPSSTGGSSSTLTVTTSASTPAGSSTLTITGTSGSQTRTTTATLVVQPLPGPDYSLSASPTSASSTMSVTTSATTPAATYTLTITGISGSLSHTTSVTLVVQPPPDYSLAANPSNQTVTQGNGVGYNLSVSSSGGFAGSVTLSAGGLPSGVSAAFSPNPTSATSAMFVATSATTPTGTYSLTIAGASGSLSHAITVTLVVQPAPTPDYSLAASPSSQAVTQGQGVGYTVSIVPTAGFAGQVTLSTTGLPSGAAATFSPNPTGASSTMSVTTSAATPFGSYVVTVTGVSGSLSHTTTVTLIVVGSCSTPTLTTSAPSPYVSGSGPVQLTANGQCGGGTEYWFLYKDPSTGWHTISAYSTNNTALWNADYQAGGYMFEVDIRPVGSSAAWVAYYDVTFSLSGCGVPSLTPDLPSPQSPGTTVHWTAGGTCSGTPQYLFYVRSPSGVWSIAQPWGASNTFAWSTPAADGAYLVQVNVRNAGANEDPVGDNNTAVTYNLSSCATPTLATSAPSPYVSGSGPIQLTATGQCGGGTQYEFLYKDPSTGWHTISGYSSTNTALWNADYRAGGYMFEVDIRPAGS